ncbi:MAG TPA: hypothetical protein VFJ71_02205 [Candidatus Limnocylindrales bacterium]|nr:hypothetical protein [Candidatus Limnocylindrales bacterium]
MAQTDARAGFRLPWSSDRQPAETAEAVGSAPETAEQPAGTTGWPTDDAAPASNQVASTEAGAVDPWTGAPSATAGGTDPSGPGSSGAKTPAKKPSKFLADLTKAMQAAAEEARARSVSQLQAEAKTHIEAIHGRSSTEATALRRKADDDVAAVREWSKTEIARIREETETKITARKARLETEIEESAAVIEREIEAVQKTVTDFEEEMAAFFERLLGEEDPTRFATMAENLPEPPSFEGIVTTIVADEPEAVAVAESDPATEVEAEPVAETDDAPEAVAETVSEDPAATVEDAVDGAVETEGVATDEVTTGEAETVDSDEHPTQAAASTIGENGTPAFGSIEGFEGEGEFDGEVDREAAFAAIQAAAEAAASAEVAADAAARAEAVADVAIEIIGNHDEEGESDPRFAALGLTGDLDAAEAEAFAAAGSSDEEVPEVGEDALAARLAGLGSAKGKGNAEGATSTQVIVVGLVSVASIASFKRHLGRVAGVNSVGVSSGPDGEFVFAVAHGPEVVLRDVIPSLPSFQARVTSASDGVVHVTAHDPESDG